jgi:ADP-ribose pyrophosphatase
MPAPKKQWECVRSEPGPDLKLFTTRFDYMKNPRNEQTNKMIVIESEDSANVIAMTPEDQILFVRQFRFGIQDFTVELPGGLVEPGEKQSLGVQRELEEETGYTAKFWHYLGKVPSNPVFMNSYIHHWVATEALKTSEIQWDESEDMELLLIPLEEVRNRLYEGFFQHPHTSNALILFFQWFDNIQ